MDQWGWHIPRQISLDHYSLFFFLLLSYMLTMLVYRDEKIGKKMYSCCWVLWGKFPPFWFPSRYENFSDRLNPYFLELSQKDLCRLPSPPPASCPVGPRSCPEVHYMYVVGQWSLYWWVCSLCSLGYGRSQRFPMCECSSLPSKKK